MLWRCKYRYLDKQKTLHLGGWPTISLADARIRRDEAKKLVAAGIDPALEKKRARIAAKYAAANTFEEVAKEWPARKSGVSGKSVSVRVDLGARYIVRKKKQQQYKAVQGNTK